MNKRLKGQVSRKTLLKRTVLIFCAFLVVLSISYPAGANWVIDRFNAATNFQVGHVDFPIVLGLDLQGGTHLEYVADLSQVADSERADAMDGVRDVIERRVNQMGVSEPLVQVARAGDQYRLTVELAGVRDVNEAIRMIGETPILEFRVENEEADRPLTDEEKTQLDEENLAQMQRADEVLNRAEEGESIADLARETSDDPVSAANGGDLGWLAENETYPNLLEAFQGAEPGLADKVMDDGDQLYVAELVEKRDAGEQVHASHIIIQWAGAAGSSAERSKEEAEAKIRSIKEELTSENFDEKAREYSEEPGAGQTSGDLGWFGRGEMVEPFENAVFGMQTGEISDIVETAFGFHLIKKTGDRELSDVHVRAVIFDKKDETDIVNPEPRIRTDLTGKQLERATLDFDQQTNMPHVTLQFDDEGAKLFAEMTRTHVGKPIAIYLDGQPISIPTVEQEIPSGQAVINGSFTIDEAKLLAQRLQAGALPVPINLIAQQSVGPVLGAQSVAASVQAGLIGFLLVMVFMILFYRLPGLVSVFALGFYAAFVLAIFKIIPVTLSLSGIAGFILSIGMAVDANVLIFERLKEELETDKSMMANVDEAFKRAWSSIRDGNVTTLIVCFILYTFTSSLIKGFALTLGIGIILSMFTAIVVTKTVMKLLVATSLSRKVPWLFLKKKQKTE